MAPALTQAAEPHNLADAPCHTPDDARSSSTLYDSLKCLSKCIHSNQGIFDSEHLLIPNGDCVPSGLAPPACGWAEGRPLPNSTPCNSNMDEQPPLPLSISNNTCFSSDNLSVSNPAVANETMGLQSCVSNIYAASNLIPKGSEAASTAPTPTSTVDDTNAILSNQNELLELVGWDFNNVNDIIDTLQRFASNPELLDAAARDLDTVGAVQNASQCQTPEARAALNLERLAVRQRQLEHRRLFLLRRLRRVTAQGLGVTVSSQLSHLTRHVRSLLEEERIKHPEREKVDERISLDLLHKESMKSMSTSDLISLVRRVEASNNLQRLKETKIKSEAKDVSFLPASLCTQIDSVASEVKSAALHHSAHDSDATESSSGGESCDETDGFSNINTNYKPIRERAFYKYCRMRGWVASKWMWLQAQIADLDNKIAKQQKMHSDIKRNKGAVQLAEEALPLKAKPPVRSPAHLDMQDPALTCIGTPSSRTILNGYHPPRMEDMGSLHGYSGLDTPKGCARTLGIQRVKRRRYVRPSVSVLKRSLGVTSACTTANKARKVCPVFCKCVPPLTCILCDNSRNNSCKNNVISFGNHVLNSKKLGAVALFNQSVEDSLSKVDEAFHPVLSRYTEMLQGELYYAAFKSPEWQTKALANKLLPQKEDLSSNSSGSLLEPSAKRRRDRNGRRRLTRDDGKERIAFMQSRRNLNGEDDGEDVDDELSNWQVMSGSNCSSPCPSPATLTDKGSEKEGKAVRKQSVGGRQKQNSTSSSYDINNIVIPYSMAATSRVEMLQYKEIPTPKWRVEEIPPLLSWSRNADEEDEEDVSEEATMSRHGRSEELERKKFLQYLQTQVNSSRSSRSRRADSSGTNTPDHPMSPRPLEPMDTTSPLATPPGTPLLAPSEDSNQSTTQTSAKSTSQQSTVLTLSLSSLQSSLLKTNPPDDVASGDASSHSLRPQKPPSSAAPQTPVEGGPALRTRRVLSSGGGAQMRSASLGEEQNEKDRVSPFPCRDFPLTEHDYEHLVHENRCSSPSPRDQPPSLSATIKGQQIISVPDAIVKMDDVVYNNNNYSTPAGTDVEMWSV